jgi:hypothetical protein
MILVARPRPPHAREGRATQTNIGVGVTVMARRTAGVSAVPGTQARRFRGSGGYDTSASAWWSRHERPRTAVSRQRDLAVEHIPTMIHEQSRATMGQHYQSTTGPRPRCDGRGGNGARIVSAVFGGGRQVFGAPQWCMARWWWWTCRPTPTQHNNSFLGDLFC